MKILRQSEGPDTAREMGIPSELGRTTQTVGTAIQSKIKKMIHQKKNKFNPLNFRGLYNAPMQTNDTRAMFDKYKLGHKVENDNLPNKTGFESTVSQISMG